MLLACAELRVRKRANRCFKVTLVQLGSVVTDINRSDYTKPSPELPQFASNTYKSRKVTASDMIDIWNKWRTNITTNQQETLDEYTLSLDTAVFTIDNECLNM